MGDRTHIPAGHFCHMQPTSDTVVVLQDLQNHESLARLANTLVLGEPAPMDDGSGDDHESASIHPG